MGLLFLHFISPKKCYYLAVAYFFFVCQDIISNEFYFPVTLRCHYFEIFQN